MLAGVGLYCAPYLALWREGHARGGPDLGWIVAWVPIMRRVLLEEGRLLDWYSVIFDGMPLIGHPHSMLFYPPSSVPLLALGANAGVRALYVIAHILAAVGMRELARAIGAGPWAASWAGLLFAVSGTMAARIYAGHVEWVAAMWCVPMALALLIRALETGGGRLALVGGMVHGMSLVAGNAYILAYLGIAVPCAAVAYVACSRGWRRLVIVGVAWAIGLALMSAGKLLAFADVAPAISRTVEPYVGSQPAWLTMVHLVHPLQGFGYVAPWGPSPWDQSSHGRGNVVGPTGPYGWWEFTHYIGVVAAVFAIVALIMTARHRRTRRGIAALGAVGLTGVMWAANEWWYSPIHWLYELSPLVQQFRVPTRALLLTAIATIPLAALGLGLASRRGRAIAAVLAIAGLAEVYAHSNWVPGVAEPEFMPAVRAALDQIEQRDPGPFLLFINGFGYRFEAHALAEVFQRELRVGRYGSFVVPSASRQHGAFPLDRRVRYQLTLRGQRGPVPGSWSPALTIGDVVILENSDAVGDALVFEPSGVRPVRMSSRFVDRPEIVLDRPSSGDVLFPVNAGFPGWAARVDGGEWRPATVAEGFVSVRVGPDARRVELRRETPRVRLVLALGVLPWAVLVALLLRRR
jgi:hypothetical protein